MANSSLCSIPDCGKPTLCRGLCNAHYIRLQRHGDPLAGRTPRGELLRFIHDVALKYEGDDCLLWPYSNVKGYGKVSVDGRELLVTRYICTIVNGPPPTSEHEAAHSCGKGHLGCVTHGHLSWKTSLENSADMLAHGNSTRGERHGNSKLTPEDVRQIRSLRGVVMQKELANRFGVGKSTICGIQKRTKWEWLE